VSALADDWGDAPPPVQPHPRDAFARGLMPWDTAPQPAPVGPKPRPTLPTCHAAAVELGVSPSSLWKRLRRKRIGAHVALPLEVWRTLAAGLARRAP
jgi:hypothetical protein